MAYLYACLFSNSVVKVGRSIDADSRIHQHEERVRCMGITLADCLSVECVGSAAAGEAALIERCIEAATNRHASEWFEGLDFAEVRKWVFQFAEDPGKPVREFADADGRVDFRYVIKSLSAAGYKQNELAHYCRCNQSSISDLVSGKTRDPSYFIGAKLMELQKSILREQPPGPPG
jgi:hypothetical protein